MNEWKPALWDWITVYVGVVMAIKAESQLRS